MIASWVWLVFLFVLGACVGSFLNVVAYRLPREMSLIEPSSHCPACKQPISWYDNVPILGWFLLRGRCRRCGGAFSIRYAAVELLTALLFVAVYVAYFRLEVRHGLPEFTEGGWLIYAGHMVLICGLLASSLIDAEHWIIPLSVSYTVAGAGLGLSVVWPYILSGSGVAEAGVIPLAGPRTGALALGAALGLGLGNLALWKGLIKRSFAELAEAEEEARKNNLPVPDVPVSVRREMVRELAFLAPVVVGGWLCYRLLATNGGLGETWNRLLVEQKWLGGLLGSVFGFMIGGGVVWATRVLGSLALGREAMGLGDVHLMAAVGAVLGWRTPALAFFVAPFLGLGYALTRLVVHRTREIPYGPFLSAATVVVMLVHDPAVEHLRNALGFGGLP